MKLINIGFGNFVSADKVIAVVSPDSAPIKRIIQDAKEQGMLIDATYGRKTRSVIIALFSLLYTVLAESTVILSTCSVPKAREPI